LKNIANVTKRWFYEKSVSFEGFAGRFCRKYVLKKFRRTNSKSKKLWGDASFPVHIKTFCYAV
jgi:hypothetical protein